ncbi:MAG: hypothetical protein JWR60_1982 [Polaromonas sp.]|nr:hypothetical protein [Polaromonas sp.]
MQHRVLQQIVRKIRSVGAPASRQQRQRNQADQHAAQSEKTYLTIAQGQNFLEHASPGCGR